MLWCPWAWLHSLRCRVFASSATPAPTKTSENAEGQIVGLHGSTAIYISATILLFLVFFADNFVQYATSLAINSASRSSLNHSTIIVDCKGHGGRARHESYALRLASCYNKRCVRAYIGNKTKVRPIQFSNRPDICCVGLEDKRQKSFIKS